MKKRPNTTAMISTLMITALLSGCNAFTQNYEGERFDRTSHAHLVENAPESARKIGESRVLTYEDLSAEDAMKTAQRDSNERVLAVTQRQLAIATFGVLEAITGTPNSRAREQITQ